MVVKTLELACFWMSSAPITVVGVGASKPPVVIRVDETVTDSMFWACCSCAMAGAAIIIARTAVLLDNARRRFTPPAFRSKGMDFPLLSFPESLC